MASVIRSEPRSRLALQSTCCWLESSRIKYSHAWLGPRAGAQVREVPWACLHWHMQDSANANGAPTPFTAPTAHCRLLGCTKNRGCARHVIPCAVMLYFSPSSNLRQVNLLEGPFEILERLFILSRTGEDTNFISPMTFWV